MGHLRLPSRLLPAAIFLAVALGAPTVPAHAQRDVPCVEACHRAKSEGYQSCRAVRPDDRAGRRACFNAADKALASCLKRCK
ncbi:MAG: hypothetical protein IT371_28710 [Deltaproteobacteria bacterium]|nr:hypothetical protein [Deltaproteobacteria bacterium]